MATDFEASFRRKRLLSFTIAAGHSFLGGCEYVVILPTVWNYLQSVGVKDEYWLGFTVSVYSFAAAIAGVIGGRVADIFMNHTKTIVIISIAIRAFGSVQYALGISVWNILCARLICDHLKTNAGIGAAAGTALLAEICRTTAPEERTRFLSIYNGAFNFGLLIGPGVQFLISFINFKIFFLQVTALNAPGVFMGILWILYWLATVFMYHNLAEEFKAIEKRRKHKLMKGGDGFSDSLNERCPASRNADLITSVSSGMDSGKLSVTEVATFKQYKAEFLTDTFVLLFSMFFILLFCVCGVETIIPVITEKCFGFGVFENSLIYMVGGMQALVVFFGIAFVGPYIRETTLQIIGWLLLLFSQIWLLIVIPNFEHGNTTHAAYFILGIMILYMGDPIFYIANTGLLSKILSNETQGLGQGICRLALSMGVVFGPSWAGSTINNPYLFLGVTITILFINGVMLGCSFPGLRRAENTRAEVKAKQAEYERLISATPVGAEDDELSDPFINDGGN